jgi:hypothetical protein
VLAVIITGSIPLPLTRGLIVLGEGDAVGLAIRHSRGGLSLTQYIGLVTIIWLFTDVGSLNGPGTVGMFSFQAQVPSIRNPYS